MDRFVDDEQTVGIDRFVDDEQLDSWMNEQME
jgi:hypothetical protein